MPILQRWADISDVVVGPTVSKKIVNGERASMVRLSLKAGSRADRHAHPFEQFVHVISGGGMLDTAEGTQRFGAGSLFHFAPGCWHSAVFDEDTILVETNLKPATQTV